jgi:hypothetical protein
LQRCNPGLQRGCSAATLCNLLQPSTRGCSGVAAGLQRGLQRVAEGCRGLQRVAAGSQRGCSGVAEEVEVADVTEVRRGCRGLQRVAVGLQRGCRGLQLRWVAAGLQRGRRGSQRGCSREKSNFFSSSLHPSPLRVAEGCIHFFVGLHTRGGLQRVAEGCSRGLQRGSQRVAEGCRGLQQGCSRGAALRPWVA